MEEIMRRSKRMLPLVVLTALFGALIPAIASSDGPPTVNGLDSLMWSPGQVTVAAGGSVNFANSSGLLHGIHWDSGPSTPSCNGVPLDGATPSFSSSWSGSCSFSTAGTYRYYCSYHGPSMSGTVIVSADGATTTTSSTSTPPPGGTPPPASGGSSALASVSLPASQRGTLLHGSVKLGQSGSRLEIKLSASGAALGGSGTRAALLVGRLLKRSVGPGKVSFSIPLSTSAKRALRRHGRLAVKVLLTVTPAGGGATRVTRHVTLHR
jgi:plastocyanin